MISIMANWRSQAETKAQKCSGNIYMYQTQRMNDIFSFNCTTRLRHAGLLAKISKTNNVNKRVEVIKLQSGDWAATTNAVHRNIASLFARQLIEIEGCIRCDTWRQLTATGTLKCRHMYIQQVDSMRFASCERRLHNAYQHSIIVNGLWQMEITASKLTGYRSLVSNRTNIAKCKHALP